jgi:hypothetical protein
MDIIFVDTYISNTVGVIKTRHHGKNLQNFGDL